MTNIPPTDVSPSVRTMNDLVYVGFNKHVVALDRYTGEVVWKWDVPKGMGYIALLVDGDRLIVSAQGYMYCLDPLFGQQVWSNPLEGLGVGVPCLASVNANAMSTSVLLSGAAEVAQQASSS